MVFSIGNILTIVIVILILAIFRQIDRNNRSLEKIKRYSDKVTGELDKFIDGKTVELKNLAIELNVHHKAGKEILKRITGVEDSLNERAGEIDGINIRIGEYDKVLEDLIGMTGKVDENLKRLHEESEFVDKVGRRVKDAQIKIVQLENNLPAIKDEFARQNAEELKALKGDVLREIETDISSVMQEIERSQQLVNDSSDYLTRLEDRRDKLEEETLKNLQNNFQEYLEKAEEESGNIRKMFREDIHTTLEQASANGSSLAEEMKKAQQNLNLKTVEAEKTLTLKLNTFHDRANAIEKEYQNHLKSAAERGKKLEDNIFIKLKESIEEKAGGVGKDIAVLLENTTKRLEGTRSELMGVFNDTRSELKTWQTKIQKSMEDTITVFNNKYSNNSAEIENRLKTYFLETDKRQEEQRNNAEQSINDFENMINEKLNELESRLTEYEGDVSYRIAKIENVDSDIDELEKNLRIALKTVAEKVRNDFKIFEKDLAKNREEEKGKALEELEEINQSMAVLEKGLVELKSKAYENVSEKLKMFEDDFFADLKARDQGMKLKFENWQDEITHKQNETAEEFGNITDALEKDYTEKLKEKYISLQSKTFQQYEKLEGQVAGFQDRINERVNLSDNSINSFEESLRKDVKEIRENSKVFFQKEFTEQSISLNDQITKNKREVDSNLKNIGKDIELNKKEISSVLDSVKSDVTVWQTKMLQEIKITETEMKEGLSVLKVEASETVGIIRDDFSVQRGEYDSFLLELQRKSKELQTEIDQKVRDFRVNAQDVREKTELMQKNLYGKIEENYNALFVNLEEIDKKQKNFIVQTKVFDRADFLKEELQENIEDLKSEITGIEVQRKELKETERKFSTIKKLGGEVSSKLTRFLNEKRRIEEMEGDFKKLINISQTIDVKLDQVTTSHDRLQSIMMNIRKMEDLEKEVSQKYERLENKGKVVDVTIDGIDKNFQQLEDMEQGLNTQKDELFEISQKFNSIDSQLSTLSKNKKQADQAIKQIESIDGLLKDVEERMDKMQKAREWLAKTETRFEEINKQAQEQVKFLIFLLAVSK